MHLKYIAPVAAVAVVALAAGCGGESSASKPLTSPPPSSTSTSTPSSIPSSTPAQPAESKEAPQVFLERLIRTRMLGQFEREYAWLDESERSQVTFDAFVTYAQSEYSDLGSYDLKSLKALDTYPTKSHGLNAVAVTMRITIADSAGTQESRTQTVHAIDRGDHWTWLLASDDAEALGVKA